MGNSLVESTEGRPRGALFPSLGMTQPLLEIKNLTVEYAGGIRAVEGVSFTLHPGTATGLVGESGCGKTTLLESIFGYRQEALISGQIYYQGHNLLELPLAERRRLWWKEIGMVLANSQQVLNPVLTVGEQVREVFRPSKTFPTLGQLFTAVGLNPNHGEHYPHQLSGGMRQKVLIAMALAANPRLLLIDEPTSALDPISQAQIRKLLLELQREMGITTLIVSHDLTLIEEMTQRILVMCRGNIMEEGPTPEIINHPKHPYTRGLLYASPAYFPYKDLWGMQPPEGKVQHRSGCAFADRCTQKEGLCQKSRPPLHKRADRKIACHFGGIRTLLEVRDLHKTFPTPQGDVIALRGVELSIDHGEVVALLGETGSGKSTLAAISAGITKADRGEVLFLKRPVQDHWATRTPGGIQIVFQEGAINPRFSIRSAIEEPLLLWKEDKGSRLRKVQRAMEQLGLTNLPMERKCGELSHGQLQRVAIARALVMDPKLLIADEIAAHLDPSGQANLLRLLKELQYARGFSMLFITHDVALAQKIADRVYILQGGQILEEGPARKVFAHPTHGYTKLLLA